MFTLMQFKKEKEERLISLGRFIPWKLMFVKSETRQLTPDRDEIGETRVDSPVADCDCWVLAIRGRKKN
jgi:hypothetical protein